MGAIISRALRVLAAILAALLVLVSLPAVGLAAESDPADRQVEIAFRLTAQIDSTTLDARVEAGARLLMERSADGRGLSLVRPLEPAWKLYRVNPLGPGGEAKMAAEVTLPEPTWRALEAARGTVEREATERWSGWKKQGYDDGQSFDGAFAFVVIGPPAGRFEISLAADGRPARIDNRLTDRWLPGTLDALFASWSSRPGYWFWNAEAKPFEWEPHVYHALADALALLAESYLPPTGASAGGAGRSVDARWEQKEGDLAAKVAGVLATLAPKTRGRLRVPEATPVTVHRTRVLDERALPRVDRLQAEVVTRGATVVLEIGLQPLPDDR